jgi:hypothetical protein
MNELEMLASEALKKYGKTNQINKAIEELGELVSDLARYQNNTVMILDLVGEIADCTIMLAQLRQIFGEDTVDGILEQKLNRLENLIYVSDE